MNEPQFATESVGISPVSGHIRQLAQIPPSRMFLIKRGLKAFKDAYPERSTFDASQGDGGASLPGVSADILDRAHELQLIQGTGYNQPFGTRTYQEAVFNEYWGLDAKWGLGPENVIATVGGRDGLLKAYQAMMALGHQRQGDAILVSRVPWISYNWGPFGLGGNTLLAPGDPEDGWAYTPAGLEASVKFARKSGREVAGVVNTSPDNPTGRTMEADQQAELARAALRAGAAYVLFDWIYHYVTDEDPMDLNSFLSLFDQEDRRRLIFLDGLTKSLGASNVRNAHLIASTEVTKFIVALASHGVIPPFHGQAVAMAAIENGYANACRPIVEPTNASRRVLKKFLDENNFTYILGKGYYAFLNLGAWVAKTGWQDTEPFGSFLAEEHGLAVVPGVFFSSFGGDWVRFSYATPPDVTLGALKRLKEALGSIQ